jgi:glycosyltransferase involved in cell wall biosynthesis
MNDLPTIQVPYLLVVNIQCYQDKSGDIYLDPLWYKDLKKHLYYLKNFTLACPCVYQQAPEGFVNLMSDSLFSEITIVNLPKPKNYLHALWLLPTTLVMLWKAIQSSTIVHCGIAGWPIPLGWFATAIAKLQGKYVLIIVESAPWRLKPGIASNFRSRIEAIIWEKMGSWCVNNSDLALFTQSQYKESLLTKRKDKTYITPASWIDEAIILSEEKANEIWNAKLISPISLKLIFVGRLVPEKGVLVLLKAMEILEERAVPVTLDILGEGELLTTCQQASNTSSQITEIKILGTVSYGVEFFNLLQKYHAIAVPSLSDEQPRIVYDGYSQAIPILASKTAGLQDVVQDSVTGKLVHPNDAIALADLLESSWHNLEQLKVMGMQSLHTACGMTHQKMHENRWEILDKEFIQLNLSKQR